MDVRTSVGDENGNRRHLSRIQCRRCNQRQRQRTNGTATSALDVDSRPSLPPEMLGTLHEAFKATLCDPAQVAEVANVGLSYLPAFIFISSSASASSRTVMASIFSFIRPTLNTVRPSMGVSGR